MKEILVLRMVSIFSLLFMASPAFGDVTVANLAEDDLKKLASLTQNNILIVQDGELKLNERLNDEGLIRSLEEMKSSNCIIDGL